jgi:hypothetical protein
MSAGWSFSFIIQLEVTMPRKDEIWTVKKFVLYNFDLDRVATTKVFANYGEAAEAAKDLDNVIVLPLVIQAVTAASCAAAG